MRQMKDSGLEWVGIIPSHWEVIRGKYILKYLQKPVREDDGVITCFRDGEVTLRCNRREEGFTMSDKEIGYQGVDVGDLVVHGMDGFAGAIGISDSRGKASPVLNILDTEQNKRYIMYYLRSMAHSDVFLALATGIRVRSCDLRWNKLSELSYPVPPLEEQEAIAVFIDNIIAKTNVLADDIQAEIDTLEEYKRSIITEAVTKGLDAGVTTRNSGVGYLGRVPSHWLVIKLKYLTKIRNENGLFEPDFSSYIGMENVVGYSNILSYAETAYETSVQSVCKKNDVLFGKLRPYLAKVIMAPYDGFCSSEFLVFSDFTGDKRFLRFSLLNKMLIDDINSSTYGAKMPRANSTYVLNSMITVPSVAEQVAIADFLDDKCAEIDGIISKKQEQLIALDVYKKSVIHEYITGKKEVDYDGKI